MIYLWLIVLGMIMPCFGMDLSRSSSRSSSKEKYTEMKTNDEDLLKIVKEQGVYGDLTANDRIACLDYFFKRNGPVSQKAIKDAKHYAQNATEIALLDDLNKSSKKAQCQQSEQYVSVSPKKKEKQDRSHKPTLETIWERKRNSKSLEHTRRKSESNVILTNLKFK